MRGKIMVNWIMANIEKNTVPCQNKNLFDEKITTVCGITGRERYDNSIGNMSHTGEIYFDEQIKMSIDGRTYWAYKYNENKDILELKDSPYHGNVFASIPRLYFEHLYGISIDEKSLNAIDYFAKKMLDNYSNMANVSKEEINTLEAVIEKTVEQIKGRIKEIEEELDEYER